MNLNQPSPAVSNAIAKSGNDTSLNRRGVHNASRHAGNSLIRKPLLELVEATNSP